MTTKAIRARLAKKAGVWLDISLGGVPQPNAVTLGPKGDIPHDPRRLPFPLPSGCVHTAVVTHVLEYLDPTTWFAWWDELHRVMRPHGVVYLSGPYGGDESQGWLSDPGHRVRVIEQSFAWLDPRMPMYGWHHDVGRPTPKPWHAQEIKRVPGSGGTLSYNCILKSAGA